MDDLDDELDLRYHRDLKPDVYYRCPSSESLDGALRNEIEKHVASLIPMDIVTEFVFAKTSTITVPVIQQPNLETLFEPADFAQSITVEHALCYGIEGKERLKLQRAIARSFVEMIQGIDGFRYAERQASNREGSAGVRFKYVCLDSRQNRVRKSNAKKDDEPEETDGSRKRKRKSGTDLPTYDCGGAIYVRFSTEREAVNVMYVHNPIHRDAESVPENSESILSSAPTTNGFKPVNGTSTDVKKKTPRKKKNNQGAEGTAASHDLDLDLDMSTSPEASTKQKRGKKSSQTGSRSSAVKQKSKTKQSLPSKSRQKAPTRDTTPEPVQLVRGKCLRCREKGIKCNEGKPSCNQCLRGLWTCQYETPGPKKRSKDGCLNCRSRKRKCTEERPSCAHCLKVDDDCVYGGYA